MNTVPLHYSIAMILCLSVHHGVAQTMPSSTQPSRTEAINLDVQAVHTAAHPENDDIKALSLQSQAIIVGQMGDLGQPALVFFETSTYSGVEVAAKQHLFGNTPSSLHVVFHVAMNNGKNTKSSAKPEKNKDYLIFLKNVKQKDDCEVLKIIEATPEHIKRVESTLAEKRASTQPADPAKPTNGAHLGR